MPNTTAQPTPPSASIALIDGNEYTDQNIRAQLGGEPTLIITIGGGKGAGKTSIAHGMKNSIKKNFLSGQFKHDARVLIVVQQAEKPVQSGTPASGTPA